LPGTFDDETQFKKVLENFKFPEDDTTMFELHDPNYDEIGAKIKEIKTMVYANVELNLRTFFTLFYAGHGAM